MFYNFDDNLYFMARKNISIWEYFGQIYDAYSLLLNILTKANKRIIVIDNYAGKELLDILRIINMSCIYCNV